MADGVTLRALPPVAQLGLRGDAADPGFALRVRDVLGFALPTEPNAVSARDGLAALWLGPDEWLIVGAPAGLLERLRDALSTMHAAAIDLGASRVVFELAGAGARDVLGKGCALDLHPRAFPAGSCAQTALARAGIILELVDEMPRFRIFVRRSFARYLAAWLADAAAAPGPTTP